MRDIGTCSGVEMTVNFLADIFALPIISHVYFVPEKNVRDYFHISKYCFERVEFGAKTIFVLPKTANAIIPYMKIEECCLTDIFPDLKHL